MPDPELYLATTVVVLYGDGVDYLRTTFHDPDKALQCLDRALPNARVLDTVTLFAVPNDNHQERTVVSVTVPEGTPPPVVYEALIAAQLMF